MKSRSLVDLITERRANVVEQMHSRDPMTIAMLQAHIDEIDRELAARRPQYAGCVGAGFTGGSK